VRRVRVGARGEGEWGKRREMAGNRRRRKEREGSTKKVKGLDVSMNNLRRESVECGNASERRYVREENDETQIPHKHSHLPGTAQSQEDLVSL
jgi:hypothetical protein